jgi:signal transduction histidine kinase/CheY-like chemotaxis protein/HPt (histidine-containing phosphotransfer) domain-containing protein
MKKQLSRYSLKYRIAIIIFVLELIMMAAVLGVTLSHSLKTSQEHLTENENVLLDILGDLSRIALITSEYDELQPYIEQVTSVPHVVDVFLANHESRIVVSSTISNIGKKLVRMNGDSSTIWKQKDIKNATGKIGTLAIIFSHQDLIEANTASLNLGIQVALSGMVIIALVGVIIGYLLTRRLESLAVSAQRIAEGDLEVRTNLKGKDEVAIVGQAFDHMAENIKTYIDNLIDSEEELRKAQNTLEKRVEERTRQLAIATDEAIRANNSKSTFLANISHEIRTPLTAIIGFSDSLHDNSLSKEERKEAINTINESGKHLLRIINDILDLSKVEAEKIELENIEVSPHEIAYELKSIIQHQANEKGLYFKLEYNFPLPKTIYTDPVRIRQILLNLCSNALKFTEIGGVTLKIACDCTKNEMIFKVIDTGIGLDETQLDRIFNAFEQADSSTTRRYGGTGLGLSLSRMLARLLGGDISVSSTPEVGSCFTLAITTGPIDKSELIYHAPGQTPLESDDKVVPDRFLKGQVLLAEDNRENQKLITMYLRRAGLDVEVASNGQEAVNLANEKKYDLIIMDIHMPIMSGIEAVKILRSRGYTGPISALTANAMQEGVKKCLDAGCNTFLAKPIDMSAFYTMLNKYLASRDEAKDKISEENISPIISTLANEGDGAFIELIEEFVDTLPETLNNIRQLFKNEEWEKFKDEVHTLKGTGGNFGFEQITTICRLIETELHDNNTQAITGHLDDLDAIYNRIQSGLQTA